MYSDEIPQICSFCVFAEAKDGEQVFCNKKRQNRGALDEGCKYYKYDILKRPVRRRKAFHTDFTEDDFKL